MVKIPEVKLPKVWGPHYERVHLKSLTLRFVHTEPLAIHQFWFRFSDPSTGFFHGFQSLLQEAKTLCICMSVSPVLGQRFACTLLSLKNLRRVVDFPICLAFYLFGQSGNFQAPYMRNQKQEVLHFSFVPYIQG